MCVGFKWFILFMKRIDSDINSQKITDYAYIIWNLWYSKKKINEEIRTAAILQCAFMSTLQDPNTMLKIELQACKHSIWKQGDLEE